MTEERNTVEALNRAGQGMLPGHLGIQVLSVQRGEIRTGMSVEPHLMAPNGFLHAGSLVTLADTTCGYGCRVHLPDGAQGFTTIELKSNHLSTAREGSVQCVARPVHLGGSTQVWDATITHRETGKTLVLFRCTQMLLYPRA
ncbi:PaaI family thioesterase [Xylophilus sp. ASV27]|uniref:PaaI family thioesterase n=1 Tax=Xylophilus sp. ASV27 TaxID=2795129 RepID=UPI0018ED3AD1|nr:PaaI family thioesterase [Xylophilus sp. ASV27]